MRTSFVQPTVVKLKYLYTIDSSFESFLRLSCLRTRASKQGYTADLLKSNTMETTDDPNDALR